MSTLDEKVESPNENGTEQQQPEAHQVTQTVSEISQLQGTGLASSHSQPQATQAAQSRCDRTQRNRLKRNAKAMKEFSKHQGDGAGAPLRPKRVWLRSPHWLTASYRSKNEELHRLFKQIPADAMLVDDYSCAVQKEILVHGRMYVTQEHLCFHSNIFGFETSVVIRLADVDSITPEKTAHIIPNALRVVMTSEPNGSGKEKSYWFTSFISRDTSFTILMKIWQNVLMGSPMTAVNLRHFACRCWGTKPDVEMFSESKDQSFSGEEHSSENGEVEETDGGESEDEIDEVECGCESHVEPCHVDQVYPVSAEQLFDMFFTDSDWMRRLSDKRKLTDVQPVTWEPAGDESALEKRDLVYTMPIKASIGPKSTVTTEQQRLVERTPGRVYKVQVEVISSGVPYCDNFYTYVEYCITHVSRKSARLRIGAAMRFRKSMMGFVKSMIERQAVDSMKEFYTLLKKSLAAETTRKKSSRGGRSAGDEKAGEGSADDNGEEAASDDEEEQPEKKTSTFMSGFLRSLAVVFFVLLLVNVGLLVRLLFLPPVGPVTPSSLPDVPDQLPLTPDGWQKLLNVQRQMQDAELQQVRMALDMSGKLLSQVVESLESYASMQGSVAAPSNPLEENISKLSILQQSLKEKQTSAGQH